MINVIERSAVISTCGLYRYELKRRWSDAPMLGALWLNPSIANAEIDDPSLNRGMGFAFSHGYGGLWLCNPFAYRATNFEDLLDSAAAGIDVVGRENHEHILTMARSCKRIHCGWGSNASEPLVAAAVKNVLDVLLCPDPLNFGIVLYHLGLTKHGHPKHPLYLKSDTKLTEWKRSKAEAA